MLTRCRAAAGCRPDDGVSLVEVMVAMVVFVIGSLSLLTVLAASMSGTSDNRSRLTAANLAASDLDDARALGYSALVAADYTRTVDGRDYRVVREVVATLSSGGDPSSCASSGAAQALAKRVSTRVEAMSAGAPPPVRADTLVRAPLLDPVATAGALSVEVVDRDGAPLAGLPVQAAGADRTTDAGGCAFFDAVAPGTYTATVQRAGSVTPSGQSTLTTSVLVAAGQIASALLRIDASVPVTVTSDVFAGGTAVSGYVLPTGLSARLAAPERTMAVRVESPPQAVSAGVALTWASFPDPGGYDAYLGPCSPVVHTAAEPGSTPAVVLPLSPVDVSVAWQSGTGPALDGQEVTVSWLSSNGCVEPLTYSARTTCATDCSVRLAVPAGTWRLQMVGASGHVDVTVEPRTPLATTLLVA